MAKNSYNASDYSSINQAEKNGVQNANLSSGSSSAGSYFSLVNQAEKAGYKDANIKVNAALNLPSYRVSAGTPSVPKSSLTTNLKTDKSTLGGYGAEKQQAGIGGTVNEDVTVSTVYSKPNNRLAVPDGMSHDDFVKAQNGEWDNVDKGKLVGGIVVQGADTLTGETARYADMLLGGFAQEIHNMLNQTANAFGYEGNLFGDTNYVTRFTNYVIKNRELNKAYYESNTADSAEAKAVNKYGTQVMAAVPAALLAMMTAGTSLGATATTEALTTAAAIGESSGAAQFAATAGNALKQIALNPSTQLSFVQESGNAYENALAEGATESEAAVYASIYGMWASIVEVGGTSETLGGLQALPANVRKALNTGNMQVVLAYARSIVGEMGEEVVQGMLERGLRGMYTNNTELYSDTNQRALVNPTVMGEELKGAAIVSAVLGGGQIGIQQAINSSAEKANAAANTDTKSNAATEMTDNAAEQTAEQTTGKKNYTKIANDILNDEHARQDFIDEHGEIKGDSKTAQAQYIARVLYQADRAETNAQSAPVQSPAETAAETLAETEPESVAETETSPEINPENEGQIGAFMHVRELIKAGLSFSNANEIVSDPQLRRAFQEISEITLSDNKKTAKQQIVDYGKQVKSNPAVEITSDAEEQTDTTETEEEQYQGKHESSEETRAKIDKHGIPIYPKTHNKVNPATESSNGAHERTSYQGKHLAADTTEQNTSQTINPALEIAPNNAPQTNVSAAPSVNTETSAETPTAQSQQFTDSVAQNAQPIVNPALNIAAPVQTRADVNAGTDTKSGTNATETKSNPAVDITVPEGDSFTMVKPPVNESIESTEKKGQSHSIEGIARATGFTYEGHTYMTMPEAKSLTKAIKNVSEDMAGEVTRLANKDTWSGVDIDTANTIANALQGEAAKTGDVTARNAWIKVIETHKTTSGQALQAWAKWAKSPLGTLDIIKRMASNMSAETTSRKDPKGVKTNAAAQVANDVTNAVNDAATEVANEITAAAESSKTSSGAKVDTGDVNVRQNDDISEINSRNAEKGGISDYAETIAEDIERAIDRRAKSYPQTQEQTVRQRMVSTLLRFVNEKLPSRKGTKHKVTAIDILTDYVTNQELFQQAWNNAQETLREYYSSMDTEYGQEALDYIESFVNEGIGTDANPTSVFMRAVAEAAVNSGETNATIRKQSALGYSAGQIAEQIANTLSDETGGNLAPGVFLEAATAHVNSVLNSAESNYDVASLARSAMKDIGTDLSSLAKSDSATRNNVYEQISDTLIAKYGLDGVDAVNVVNTIQTRMAELVSERADGILQNRYGAKPTTKAKADFKTRLTEAVNLGAFSSEFAQQATKQLFGIEGIAIDEDLITKYEQQTTDEGRDTVINEMIQNIADQTPSTIADKLNSLRYIGMLGNIKTLKNNFVGNILGYATRQIKDDFKSVAEYAAYKASGGKTERTSSIFHGKALYDTAMEDYRNNPEVKNTLLSHKKYNDNGSGIRARVNDARTVWKFGDNKVTKALGIANKQGPLKVVQAVEDGIDFLMNGWFGGDLFWSSQNYADSLAGWMKANNITSEMWSEMVENNDPRVETARNYAIKQAQESTYRDTNIISEQVSKLGQVKNPVGKVLTGGVSPFLFTPANVLARIEEYGPTGVVNTAVDIVKASKGTGSVNQVFESAAKTLTGAGLTALGYVLAKDGILRTKDDDDKLERLKTSEGNQDYSLNIDGTTYAIDQFTPTNTALFLGAEYYKLVEDDVSLSGDDALQLLGSMGSTLVKTSMLKGVNDTIKNATDYGDNSDAVYQMALYAIMSYMLQGLAPQIGRQTRQFLTENGQTNVTDSESWVPTSAQKALGNAYGINQADYIDMWGRKQSNGDTYAERGYNAYFGSTYPSEIDSETKAVNDYLANLYEQTKDIDDEDVKNFIPDEVGRGTKVNGTVLSDEEYDTYAQTLGQTRFSLYQQVINSEYFTSLPAAEQARVLNALGTCATNIASKEIADLRGEEYDGDYINVLYGEDGKPTVAFENLGSYVAAKKTLDYYRNEEHRDYDIVVDTIKNHDSLPEDVQAALLSRDDAYKKIYEYAYGRQTSGKEHKLGAGIDNLGSFMQTMDSFNAANNDDNWDAVDKIVAGIKNDDVGNALMDWNSTIATYKKYASGGIGSELYNKAKESVGEAQRLDDTSSDGSKEKFHGILLMDDVSEADKKKLINFTYTDENGNETAYLSKNWRNAYNIMSKYGYDMQTIYDFYVDSDYSLYQDDNGGYTIDNTDGKLGPYEVGSALYRSDLPEDVQEQIFNEFVEASGDAGRYDSWSRNTAKNKYVKYTYDFIKFVLKTYGNNYGRQKFTLSNNAALNIAGGSTDYTSLQNPLSFLDWLSSLGK